MGKTRLRELEGSVPWLKLERLGLIFAVVASLSTVVGLAIQMRSENRSVEIQVASADHLTELPSVGGLEGDFTYNGVPVTDLWRLRLILSNSGNTSLVGEGSNSMLLADDIEIALPEDSTLLDVSPATGEFYDLIQTAENRLSLRFTQWRPGEEFHVVAHLATDPPVDTPPLPSVPGRPIIDGEVLMTDRASAGSHTPRRVIDYLPAPVALTGKILGGVLVAPIGIAALILSAAAPISYLKSIAWKILHRKALAAHLDSLEIEGKEREELRKRPWLLSPHARLPLPWTPKYIAATIDTLEALNREQKEKLAKQLQLGRISGELWAALSEDDKSRLQEQLRPPRIPEDRRRDMRLNERVGLEEAAPGLESFVDRWEGFEGGRPATSPIAETLMGATVTFLISLLLALACVALIGSLIVI